MCPTGAGMCQFTRRKRVRGQRPQGDARLTTGNTHKRIPRLQAVVSKFKRKRHRSCGNVRQSNHVFANEIAGHKAERRPGTGEERVAAAKHDGAEVESILVNKTKVG